MKVFTENYAVLCKTMTDIDDLLMYFVSEEIITINEKEEMNNCIRTEKVEKLLAVIAGPLQTGYKKGFYVMLKVMKKYGTKATQYLAKQIEISVALNDGKAETKQEEQQKGLYHSILDKCNVYLSV